MKVSISISSSGLGLLVLLVSPSNTHAAGETADAANASFEASADQGLVANPLRGPDAPASLLQDEREEKADVLDQNRLKNWEAWKAGVAETRGLGFGADYTAVGFAATSSLRDDTSASGIARVFGSWALLDRSTENTGSIEFTIEHRHSYTDVPPAFFGAEVGFAGTPEPVFNDDRFRTTTLLWKQNFSEDRAVARLGFVDVKQYFDVYALASPWTGFFNLDFSTGSNTMLVLPDGAFGAMVGGYLTDSVYAAAGIADASADPTSVFQGFDTFFGDFDTFKTFEIGITGGGDQFFIENAHVAFWQLDPSAETGAPGGWGIVGSVSTLIDERWLAFLRSGWAHEGGGIYEASVSAGFGYMNRPGGNLLGVGLNWGRPNFDTFAIDLNDQLTGEIFYRVQLAENFQVAPSVQLLVDPALNPDEDFIALFGLRSRASF